MNVRIALLAAATCLSALPASSFAYPMDRRGCTVAYPGHLPICANDPVQDRNNPAYLGTVRSVFSNGEVTVEMLSGFYSGSVRSYRAEQLAVEVTELSGIAAGSKVMDRNNTGYTGVVRHVYENGGAIVAMKTGFYSGSDRAYDVNTLARSVSVFGEVYVSDSVMVRSNPNYTGTVISIFDNGIAQVRMQTGFYAGSDRAYNVSELAVNLSARRPGHGGPGPIVVPGPGPVGPGPIVVPGPGPVGPGPVTCTVVTSRRIPHVGRGMTEEEAGRNARLACISTERNALACNRQSTISCTIGRRF